jgi:pyruvate kinase
MMLKENDRRTKIIWSFEARCLDEKVAKLANEEQLDALRLVYEPGTGAKIREFVTELRRGTKTRVPVMLDVTLPARAVVAGGVSPAELNFGDTVKLVPQGKGGGIELLTDAWSQMFVADEAIYFGYGSVVMTANKVSADVIEAEVIQGGTILPHMDVHVPTTRPSPTLDVIDLEELKSIVSLGVDYIVAPGFTNPAFVGALEKICAECGQPDTWIFLKINSANVYHELDMMLPSVHGVLISRLELALFIEPAMIPVITKEIIQLCNDQAKIVCTASEMLGSMRHNATPTRAEVSDIANAVTDGSDAVVLTEEIPYGSHAVRAIRLMRKIVEDVEQRNIVQLNWTKREPMIREEMDAVAFGAYRTAQRVGAKAIVCLTREGNTAVKLASFRTRKPILAVTFSDAVLRRLSLVHGVDGVLLDADPLIDDVLPVVNDRLVRDSWLKPGDKYVFVSVTLSSLGRQESNLFTIQTLN